MSEEKIEHRNVVRRGLIMDFLESVKKVCRQHDLPEDGWREWYNVQDGPVCYRRYEDGVRTYSAYVKGSWLVQIYKENPLITEPVAGGIV